MRRGMLFTLMALATTALPVGAGTTGFSLTLEEGLTSFPAPDTLIARGDFAAAVGTVRIYSDDNVMITTSEPVAGPLCDPTTSQAFDLDASASVVEMDLAFPMAAAGSLIVFDKIQAGAYQTDRNGLEFGVYSAVTRTTESVVKFAADGYIYVKGSRVDTGSGELAYGSLSDNDCAAGGSGIDNHLTLEIFHNLLLGESKVVITTHGPGASAYTVTGVPMLAEVRSEGVGGMWLYAPPLSGRFYVDGMVCNGTRAVILSSGTTVEPTTRTRF